MNYFKTYDPLSILFIDIETSSGKASFDDEPDFVKSILMKKFNKGDGYDLDDFYSMTALKPEFGQVVCISVGMVVEGEVRMKSFVGEESDLLVEFGKMCNTRRAPIFCGHNIKAFDIPYICKRMMILGVPVPDCLDLSGRKPWDIKHLLDTQEAWSMGVFNSRTSLETLCLALGVETPKGDISGADVPKAFFDGEIDRIKAYCEKDVFATCQLYYRMTGKEPPKNFYSV